MSASQAIFLSYASEDADAARRICDALRAAGLEVWFDQSELRGGDAWDVSIRKQIKECALFVPIISANTEARLEGYFRLEWRLADQRTHLMAKGKPFLLPVAIDATKEVGARVPDSFLDVQWTRVTDLTNGDLAAMARFAERVAKLVDGRASSGINAPNAAPVAELRENLPPLRPRAPQGTSSGRSGDPAALTPVAETTLDSRRSLPSNAFIGGGNDGEGSPDGAQRTPGSVSNEPPTRNTLRALTGYGRSKIALIALGVIAIVGASIYFATQNRSAPAPTTTPSTDATKPGAINPLSVMVMPFANQTGDAQKAYIADALTSSITGDLSRIRDATIIPAATAFSLADKKLTIPQLGKEAAVRFVLTGSVTGNNEKLRISAALSDTQSGAQLWTENFDGNATDLFALQDQVTSRIGGSIGPQMVIAAARESEKRANKPEVADLLMRAAALRLTQQSPKNAQAIEVLYRQALALEPDSLTAKVGLAHNLTIQVANFRSELKLDGAAGSAVSKQAAALAEEVQRVDPNNPDVVFSIWLRAIFTGDFERAVQLAKRRVELEPKSNSGHHLLGLTLEFMGDMPGARASMEKALQFTSPARRPTETYHGLSRVAFKEDRPDEAIRWAQQAVDANPNWNAGHVVLALAYARKGDQVRARKSAAEAVRLNPQLKLDITNNRPWPGKEAAYKKYIDTQYLPAWRLAGLPE